MNKPMIAEHEMQSVHQTIKKNCSVFEFYFEEVRFLQKIFDGYYQEIAANENLDEIRETVQRFEQFKYTLKKNLVLLKSLKSDVTSAIANEDLAERPKLRTRYAELQRKIEDIKWSFMAVKREIFSMAEVVLENEKLSDHLSTR